jgi:hypothetical protein
MGDLHLGAGGGEPRLSRLAGRGGTPREELDLETDLKTCVAANDRLLKALISLLVVERPERLEQLRAVFEIARRIESPIAEMPAGAWREIEHELEIIAASVGPELH